ncbi:MAG TPA: transglycosylase SLT domain-containing protein [Nitrospira sp.]|nr:transglycosylase SLT domain-containing protein [Nitrospira sp.]
MPSRLRSTEVMVAVLFASLTAFPFLFPDHSIAEPASINSGAPAPAQDDDEDIDANLVPLEPELTITPPELSSTEEGPDKTAGTVAGQPPAAGSLDSTTQTTQQILASGSNDITYNIPVVVDPAVESHIRFFNTSIRSRFEQWLIRFSRYRPMVENIFAEFNLPSDLVNLSLVESGFNPYAYSRAKATGPWQFMKGTGKVYGLRIDHYVDERRDPIKSTVAAARYLRDLYDIFGAWPLAMAAYNAGEGKVLRALHKVQGETFSDISKTKLIRQETKQYVPRIMAATIIARSPEQYGFGQTTAPLHQFEEVVVNRALHFRAIASASGVAYEDLRLLNPELRRDATPPDDSAYHLKVPVGTAEKVSGLLDRIPTYKFPPLVSKVRHAKATSPQSYRVRRGDTLEKVSKRFNVPLRTLKTRNNLSSSVIRPGESLTISR